MLFGWSTDQVLNCPAVRFFSLMKAARKLKAQQESALFVQLCDVASISLGDSNYYSDVRSQFVNRAVGRDNKPRAALDPTDPSTVELVSNLFLEASRFH